MPWSLPPAQAVALTFAGGAVLVAARQTRAGRAIALALSLLAICVTFSDLLTFLYGSSQAGALGSLPIAFGWLGLEAQRTGLMSHQRALSLTVLVAVAGVLALFVTTSRSLRRAETKRHRAMASLQESEARYRCSLDADLAGALITTPGGRLLFANPSGLRIFGLSSLDDLANRDVSTLWADPAARHDMIERLKREGRIDHFELGGRRPNGEAFTAQANLVGRFSTSGELVEILGFFYDISEQRTVEAQLRQSQKMETVGRLAGGVPTTSTTCSARSLATRACSARRCSPPTGDNAMSSRCSARRRARPPSRANCSPSAESRSSSPRFSASTSWCPRCDPCSNA
jgi:PAS domain S-box-containing protein